MHYAKDTQRSVSWKFLRHTQGKEVQSLKIDDPKFNSLAYLGKGFRLYMPGKMFYGKV